VIPYRNWNPAAHSHTAVNVKSTAFSSRAERRGGDLVEKRLDRFAAGRTAFPRIAQTSRWPHSEGLLFPQ